MKIGVPREIKPLEGRVGLVPEACGELVKTGHQVILEQGAGEASGYPDQRYLEVGVETVADAQTLYDQAELVVKVKEPYGNEPEMLREGQLLFCFLHLAADEGLTRRLLKSGVTGIAFETVADRGGLPILAPMSDIAGRIAVQNGATLLHHQQGGRGLLLGGLPAAERGHVVILGAGQAGGNAAQLAAALGARVTVFDRLREKMGSMRELGNNVTALYPYQDAVSEAVADADLLIGAVLIPGAKAPKIVSRHQVSSMRPGSVVVDISVDQGGCIETTRPTSYEEPTYQVDGVTHFCVTNMPGAVPRSASQALSAAMMPYLKRLLEGWRDDPRLRDAVNLSGGELIYPALREQYL
ncbi:MAG: alanine dehydrogenase [Candidatus Thiodiazotropha sp. (ex Ctena orbiculata)]|uniref:alanine dehydrogenase n=1 Tax=Candidatus Thiodiazotropha taylori TaxID=2792791 RepID=A0A944QTJ3_9GAMM|nr:alanine dehydrogenase [Candidatus Thiodiazotropha taylori]MBV2137010.1 alanine dehydrogenase [Candidatus Thiodiazotropha taylori]